MSGCSAALPYSPAVCAPTLQRRAPAVQQAPASGFGRAWHWAVAVPLAGRSYPNAEWVHLRRRRHLRFLERHGPLFEDNKGDAFHLTRRASEPLQSMASADATVGTPAAGGAVQRFQSAASGRYRGWRLPERTQRPNLLLSLFAPGPLWNDGPVLPGHPSAGATAPAASAWAPASPGKPLDPECVS